jgi:hypothetical protein
MVFRTAGVQPGLKTLDTRQLNQPRYLAARPLVASLGSCLVSFCLLFLVPSVGLEPTLDGF